LCRNVLTGLWGVPSKKGVGPVFWVFVSAKPRGVVYPGARKLCVLWERRARPKTKGGKNSKHKAKGKVLKKVNAPGMDRMSHKVVKKPLSPLGKWAVFGTPTSGPFLRSPKGPAK